MGPLGGYRWPLNSHLGPQGSHLGPLDSFLGLMGSHLGPHGAIEWGYRAAGGSLGASGWPQNVIVKTTFEPFDRHDAIFGPKMAISGL